VALGENLENCARNTQAHLVLDMKAWLKLNFSVISIKRARAKFFTCLVNFKIGSLQIESGLSELN
jgi:hypothetical protein